MNYKITGYIVRAFILSVLIGWAYTTVDSLLSTQNVSGEKRKAYILDMMYYIRCKYE